MLCYLHYISAKRRLAESQKTVTMLGGERQAPEMVRAQRDFIQLETEYYAEQCVDWNFILFFLGMTTLIGCAVCKILGVL
jgi:hypothetical protein